MSVLAVFRWEGDPDALLAAYDRELQPSVPATNHIASPTSDLGIGIDQVGEWSAADCADLVAHAARSRVGAGHGQLSWQGSDVRPVACCGGQWKRGQAGEELSPIGHGACTPLYATTSAMSSGSIRWRVGLPRDRENWTPRKDAASPSAPEKSSSPFHPSLWPPVVPGLVRKNSEPLCDGQERLVSWANPKLGRNAELSD
jgi:hypothetical protein